MARAAAAEARRTLAGSYIKMALKTRLHLKDIPADLLSAKREQLRFHRHTKEST